MKRSTSAASSDIKFHGGTTRGDRTVSTLRVVSTLAMLASSFPVVDVDDPHEPRRTAAAIAMMMVDIRNTSGE